jgi:hypothetical protein
LYAKIIAYLCNAEIGDKKMMTLSFIAYGLFLIELVSGYAVCDVAGGNGRCPN